MYKLLLKLIVTAAYNFASACTKNDYVLYGKLLPGHNYLVCGPNEVLFVLMPVAFEGFHVDK